MPADKVSMTDMKPGQKGTIIALQGGRGMVNRLAAMGIFPGKKITKISTMAWQGPVTIEVDRVKIAMGYGVARQILVEPELKQ